MTQLPIYKHDGEFYIQRNRKTIHHIPSEVQDDYYDFATKQGYIMLEIDNDLYFVNTQNRRDLSTKEEPIQVKKEKPKAIKKRPNRPWY